MRRPFPSIPDFSATTRWKKVAVGENGLPRKLWTCLGVALGAGTAIVHAGPDALPPVPLTTPAAGQGDIYQRGRWEVSLESAFTFIQAPNPVFTIAGQPVKSLDYHLVTQVLGVHYRFTNAGGPWLLRGSLAGSVNLVGSLIVQGPESFFAGFALGLRYDFVQPGARLVPYVELRGGPGVTDSRGVQTDSREDRLAQQQDLTFTYLLGAGFRYDLTPRWSVNVGALDQHLSNAYLTRPNRGFDSLGFNVGVKRRF